MSKSILFTLVVIACAALVAADEFAHATVMDLTANTYEDKASMRVEIS